MKITFGKHKGKTVERLVLQEPGYINWLLRQEALGKMSEVQLHAQNLVSMFDMKQITATCSASGCNRPAVLCTVYSGNVHQIQWWCDQCNPCQLGASASKVQIVRTYKDAELHVDGYCRRRKSALQTLVKEIAEAKGLPGRVTEKAADAFFK